MRGQLLERRDAPVGTRIEDQEAADVHVRGRVLLFELEKRGVERAQMFGHVASYAACLALRIRAKYQRGCAELLAQTSMAGENSGARAQTAAISSRMAIGVRSSACAATLATTKATTTATLTARRRAECAGRWAATGRTFVAITSGTRRHAQGCAACSWARVRPLSAPSPSRRGSLGRARGAT